MFKLYSQLVRRRPKQMSSHYLTMTHYALRKTQRKVLLQLNAKTAFQLEMMFYTWLQPWTKRRWCTLMETKWWVYVCCVCSSNICKLNALVSNNIIIFDAIENGGLGMLSSWLSAAISKLSVNWCYSHLYITNPFSALM